MVVLTKRQTVDENYEDLKDPTQYMNGTTKGPSKNQERKDRKLASRKSSSAIKHSIQSIYYVLQCVVTAVIVVLLLAILSPVLVVYNVLKFLESTWVYYKTGSIAMSGQDALWLQDSDKNRLIIHSIMVLEGNDIKAMVDGVRATLQRCFAMKNNSGEMAYPRFLKCIRRGTFQYFLEEAHNFNIAQMVYEYDGEPPQSHEAMEDVVSRLCSEDLPFHIPAWRFILIPKGYENEVVVLFRMHHGLADGVSLTRFLAQSMPDQGVFDGKMMKFSNVDRMFLHFKALLVGPRILLAKLLSSPDQSIIHGPGLKGVKKVSWSKPMDLQVVKRIKNQTGTTVNDVMMACLSMSFHEYFKSKGIANPPDLTASVPVDVRSPDREIVLENNFAIVSLKLPVSEKDTLQQLYTTKANMDEIKHSGEAFVMGTAANYSVEYMPEPITNLWNKPIANNHSMVLSNVPGPSKPITVSGYPAKTMVFWPPQRDLVAIGVGMYSYAGKVWIGVLGDVNCLPDPKRVVKAFESNLARLEKCVFNSTRQTEVDSGIESH